MAHAVILFDGVCNFCNGAVNWLLERDRHDQFRFASLQSDTGRALLLQHGMDPDKLDSLVLIDGPRSYKRSTAVLHIAKKLGLPWALAFVFLIIPSPLRDALYNIGAKNRYRWWGKQDQCRIPTPDIRKKFLE